MIQRQKNMLPAFIPDASAYRWWGLLLLLVLGGLFCSGGSQDTVIDTDGRFQLVAVESAVPDSKFIAPEWFSFNYLRSSEKTYLQTGKTLHPSVCYFLPVSCVLSILVYVLSIPANAPEPSSCGRRQGFPVRAPPAV